MSDISPELRAELEQAAVDMASEMTRFSDALIKAVQAEQALPSALLATWADYINAHAKWTDLVRVVFNVRMGR